MRKLTIIVASLNAVGHVNACAGALSGLVERGHRVIFVVEKAFEGKLIPLGYEELVWSNPSLEDEEKPTKEGIKENPGDRIAQNLLEGKVIGPFTPWEKLENMQKFFRSSGQMEEYKLYDATVKLALHRFKPDLIYVDASLPPSAYYSGLPWIKQISTTPLFLTNDPNLPPGGSGLPLADSSDWHIFSELRKEVFHSEKVNDQIEAMGYERYPNDEVMPQANVLTVHAYPEELNYDVIRGKGWFNMEVFTKAPPSAELVKLSKIVCEHFLNDDLNGKFTGKYVYLSMGSMGSVDLGLMDRLLSALSTTSHKYIVSKGPRHEEYDLPANAWGDRYLPQTKLLPYVDLVITHGGNNTVTETFAEGKPMIVMPLFADQFDNAQRLEETGFGARLDPYDFTAEKLLATIDLLLDEDQLSDKLREASIRIQQSDKHLQLAEIIEKFIEN